MKRDISVSQVRKEGVGALSSIHPIQGFCYVFKESMIIQ